MRPHPDLRRGRGAQEAGAVHDRRLPGGADRGANGAGLDAHARDRVGGPGAGGRRGPRARAGRRGPTSSFARGLKALVGFGVERYAVIDVGTNSVKFHIGEREPTVPGDGSSTVPRSPGSGEGLHETGRLNPEPIERTVEAIAAMVDEAWHERGRGDRRGRDGRAADRSEQRGVRRRRTGALWRHRRDHLRRGGEPAGLPRGDGRDSAEATGSQRRLRHRRRQLAVHVRRGRPGRRAVQRRRRRGPLHRGVRPRRRRLRGRAGRGAGARSPTTSAVSTAEPRPTRLSPWAAQSRTSPRSSTA